MALKSDLWGGYFNAVFDDIAFHWIPVEKLFFEQKKSVISF
jgi:hypothetical protein